MEDSAGKPPTKINPYKVLRLKKDASEEEIRKSYKQLALRHHPDKVVPDQKPLAHARFQEIALAYAILSNPTRRSRYDLTGSTSDSIHLDDSDDFNWLDFFRTSYRENITSSTINSFRSKYQGSDEERRDVLVAYTAHKGAMAKVFNAIMLSDHLQDEARFRGYIDEALKEGTVQEHKAYYKEPKKSKNKKIQAANREAKLAEEHAKLLGLKVEDVKEVGRKGAPGEKGMGDLAALIGERKKGRAEGLLAGLEAKYLKEEEEKRGKGKKRKVEEEEMPDEEAFQAAARKLKKKKGGDEEEDDVEKAQTVRKGVTNGKGKLAKKKSKAGAEKSSSSEDEDESEEHESDDAESLGSDDTEEEGDEMVDEDNDGSNANDEETHMDEQEENPSSPPRNQTPSKTPNSSTHSKKINPKYLLPSSKPTPSKIPFSTSYKSAKKLKNAPSSSNHRHKTQAEREKARAKKEKQVREKEKMKATLRGLGALPESSKERGRRKGSGRREGR